MNRILDKPVQIGETRTRYTVKVFDDESTDPKQRLLVFLQTFVDNPQLLQAGPAYVSKFAFYHNGTCWVMAGEAEVDSL
jgi:hypothetical protein